MRQPAGFVSQSHPDYVLKLHKPLYSLKQSPHAWFSKLSSRLTSWGFCGSKADASMFIYKDKCSLVICLIYVDDILMTGNNPSLLQHFISELNVCFSLKDLGSISYFLGVKVTYQPGFLHLSWSKYISDLPKRADMVNCKPIHTPTVACAQLSLNDPPLDDPATYRSLVGALHYFTLTRPSISFSINKLCQFLHAPKTTHMQAVKRLLRYLKGTSSLGLTFTKSSHRAITCYTDADWASCPDDRRSTSGWWSVFLILSIDLYLSFCP